MFYGQVVSGLKQMRSVGIHPLTLLSSETTLIHFPLMARGWKMSSLQPSSDTTLALYEGLVRTQRVGSPAMPK